MPFEVIEEKGGPPMWTSDRRIYLTPGGQVSDEPVSGGKLLVPVGGQISEEEARSYGLLEEARPAEPVVESKPEPAVEAKPRRTTKKAVAAKP